MKQIFYYLWRARPEANIAHLTLRIFTGVAMFTHGYGKLAGGPDTWKSLGGMLTGVGFPGPEVFWGFMIAISESVGAILLAIGLFTPVASFLIFVIMAIAVFAANRGAPFRSHELNLFFLFSSFLFLLKGAGSFSIDRCLPQRK